ncbi:EcsC family protein [Phaeobacter marinintestinus]|uniref:EcsC family protein n=1 Tax=Falsiphaeobacter marinintestinus TaxID=1492905 RepID=UPI0011B74D72|nr:EcsC family protein [Phaeobacter marinintestinus]
MDDIVIVDAPNVEDELEKLASRYRDASGIGVKALTMLGGKAEGLLDRLPEEIRSRLDGATELALRTAMQTAQGSRKVLPDQAEWVNTAATTAMGAAGGFGGLPAAFVELPATTAMLLRSIQGVATQYGFDPAAENVQFDCIRVFAASGPLAVDDGADLAFISLRLTLSGGAMQKLIASVAPRLAAVLGQKLAAQTVPVLGAVAGASINLIYAQYYQQIAHVHFGLRRLAIDADVPMDTLVKRLEIKMNKRLT